MCCVILCWAEGNHYFVVRLNHASFSRKTEMGIFCKTFTPAGHKGSNESATTLVSQEVRSCQHCQCIDAIIHWNVSLCAGARLICISHPVLCECLNTAFSFLQVDRRILFSLFGDMRRLDEALESRSQCGRPLWILVDGLVSTLRGIAQVRL